MQTTAITLVIPAYNRGALIGATIDSALSQQCPFAEIIVVDDHSTDNTLDVLAGFGDRIKVIAMPKGGVQRARNTGVHAADTPWIALCDSDDLLLPDYTATLMAWLDADPSCDAMYCNFVPFSIAGNQADKFRDAPPGFFDGAKRSGEVWHDIPDLYARTMTYQPLFPSGSLIRKSTYEAIGGYDPRFNGVGSEDWEFTLRLIEVARIALCAKPLVRIRKHDGNDSADNLRQMQGCIQILEHALAQHPTAQRYREAILSSMDARRAGVFAGAFAAGDFTLATQTLRDMRHRPRDLRFCVKALITQFPTIVRRPLWRGLQAK